ncbi:MAG: HNH endonuclease [Alphaproteobacteria bacterium]|nr:HNH endonuclease [Alphaproteobacteria bacterium]
MRYVKLDEYCGYYAGSDGGIYSVVDSEIIEGRMHIKVAPVKKHSGGKYETVSLMRRDMTYVTVNVHSLVCAAFNGKPPRAGMQVRHLNGDSHDNRIENLEYGSAYENWCDKYNAGTATVGEKNPNAKLSDAERGEVARLYALGHKQVVIASKYGITQGAVSKILRKTRLVNGGERQEKWIS